MKKQILTLTMLSVLALSAHAQQPANQLLPYQNPNLSAEARANDLLSRLTLEEKTKLMMDASPAISRLGIRMSISSVILDGDADRRLMAKILISLHVWDSP